MANGVQQQVEKILAMDVFIIQRVWTSVFRAIWNRSDAGGSAFDWINWVIKTKIKQKQLGKKLVQEEPATRRLSLRVTSQCSSVFSDRIWPASCEICLNSTC